MNQNFFYDCGNVQDASDIGEGTKVSYSLRKLRSAYTGYAVKIRRSTDSAVMDVGFDGSGDLDSASMLTFIGSASATVTTWYDQSGNGINATAPNTSSEPTIVSSGALITQNGKAALSFNGTTNKLYGSNFSIGTNDYSIFAVSKTQSNSLNGRAICSIQRTGAGYNGWFHMITRTNLPTLFRWLVSSDGGTANVYTISPVNTYNFNYDLKGAIVSNSGAACFFINNIVNGVFPRISHTITDAQLWVGAYYDTTNDFLHHGFISEIIMYDSNKNNQRLSITKNITNYYNL